MSDDTPYNAKVVILDDHRRRAESLKPGDGGGTYDGMDPWQQTVETRLGELRADMRDLSNKVDNRFFWLLGVMGGGFLTLCGAIVTAYLKQADKTDAVMAAIASLARH